MELLLNFAWLLLSLALGTLLAISRRKNVCPNDGIYSRTTAWIGYSILVALLLPAISMTDDRVAMVMPADKELIVCRHEATAAPHACSPIILFHAGRMAFYDPQPERPRAVIAAVYRRLPQTSRRRSPNRAPPTLES